MQTGRIISDANIRADFLTRVIIHAERRKWWGAARCKMVATGRSHRTPWFWRRTNRLVWHVIAKFRMIQNCQSKGVFVRATCGAGFACRRLPAVGVSRVKNTLEICGAPLPMPTPDRPAVDESAPSGGPIEMLKRYGAYVLLGLAVGVLVYEIMHVRAMDARRHAQGAWAQFYTAMSSSTNSCSSPDALRSLSIQSTNSGRCSANCGLPTVYCIAICAREAARAPANAATEPPPGVGVFDASAAKNSRTD